MLHILSSCLYLSLVIQHELRIHHIISPSVACPALLYVSTLSHKRPKNSHCTYKVCLDFPYSFCLNISHYKTWTRRYPKCSVGRYSNRCACRVLIKLEIYGQIYRKILKYPVSRKHFQWEPSCSTRTQRRTDRHDEANVRFTPFCRNSQSVHGTVWQLTECDDTRYCIYTIILLKMSTSMIETCRGA